MVWVWAVLLFPNATAGDAKLSQRLLQTLMDIE